MYLFKRCAGYIPEGGVYAPPPGYFCTDPRLKVAVPAANLVRCGCPAAHPRVVIRVWGAKPVLLNEHKHRIRYRSTTHGTRRHVGSAERAQAEVSARQEHNGPRACEADYARHIVVALLDYGRRRGRRHRRRWRGWSAGARLCRRRRRRLEGRALGRWRAQPCPSTTLNEFGGAAEMLGTRCVAGVAGASSDTALGVGGRSQARARR